MAAKKVTKMSKNESPASPKAPKIILVPLNRISTKTFENSRSGKWDEPAQTVTEDTSHDWTAFKSSIHINGQETPVLLRPYSGKGKHKDGTPFEYELIVGYRRYAAIEQLAAEGKVQPVIKAEVREMSNLEARRANGLENIGRENLEAPDQAFAVFQLSNEYVAEGKHPTDEQLADELGMSQAYAGRLLGIMRNVKPKISTAWRKDGLPLTVAEMFELSKLEPAQQQERYEELLKAGQAKEERTKGPSAWIDTAVKSAARFGEFLALAEDRGLIQLQDLVWDATLIEFLAENGFVKIGKKGANSKVLEKIAKAAHKGYGEAVGKRDERLAKAEAKAAKAAAREAAAE